MGAVDGKEDWEIVERRLTGHTIPQSLSVRVRCGFDGSYYPFYYSSNTPVCN